MSQRNKLSLWQKIKRLLTTSAPHSMIDGANEPTVSETQGDVGHLKTRRPLPSNSGNENSDGNRSQNDSRNVGSESNIKTDNERSQTIASSLTGGKHEQHGTPIVDFLKQYFNERQWHYTHYQPKTNDGQQSHHLSLRMRHRQLNCGYLFRVQEANKLLAVYGILPFLIPESHQSAAMLLITQLNYDMLTGNLEMDVNDGEIRYKNAIDIEAVGMNDKIIDHLLQSVIAMTTVANELFGNLVNNQDPEEDLQTLLMALRQDVDSRTFFLPTQFVQ